ncbi:fam-g protein [Plasmodium gallinaceum]|uniref:Fam-g protein n=1 Tax=Plasmodium gallinaceum TaxID=5849 RepID=A0A1J1GUU6_PLAGA|nr:fam-g protein [Plasmodium gallinaceum]CRG96076.1 fam-g protein [Plasmodium gallinaceum]
MKTLTLYLKITTFLLLIWMYQCFYNCDSYKTLIDKNILQKKNELKYERVLAEGDIAGKKRTYSEGCLEECPLDNKKNKWENPVQYENPCDYWNKVITPQLWEQFNQETSDMDTKLKEKKWNVEWNKTAANKVNDLSSISRRRDISDEEKKKLIDSVKESLLLEFKKFLDECRKEMRENKTESEFNKGMRDNKTESEYNKEMSDNKTESEFMKEMKQNEAESKSKKEQGKNKKKNKIFDFMKQLIFYKYDNIFD